MLLFDALELLPAIYGQKIISRANISSSSNGRQIHLRLSFPSLCVLFAIFNTKRKK
jgi:hypothetical protein